LIALAATAAWGQYDDAEESTDPAPQAAEQTAASLSAEDREKQKRLDALNDERKKLQRKMVLRSRTGRLLNAAVTKIDEEEPEEALEILAALKTDRLNPFEAARVYLIRAHASYANGDPDAAVENFRSSIGTKALQIPEETGLRFNVAQLLAAQQKWPQVIDAIHEWQEYSIEKKPIAHYLLAVSYYQAEDPDTALKEAEIAVSLADEPKEGWLTLLAALYVSRERYDEAIPVFEELVTRYPKKQYWVQLSLLWGARENYKHALAVQQIAYEQGLLDEQQELERLARSYLFHELPYPAALALEKGFEDGVIEPDVESLELLANCWIASREYEKSLPPLTQAAEMSEDGNLLVRLGQVYMQREEWEKAAELLGRGIDRGALDDPGNAQLLLGISFYNDAQPERAKSSFARAAQHEKVRRAAEGWIVHIDREAAVTGEPESTGG
jgi:tetratricopeptide (TPR) repeat protein